MKGVAVAAALRPPAGCVAALRPPAGCVAVSAPIAVRPARRSGRTSRARRPCHLISN